jgi:hypothetical protein
MGLLRADADILLDRASSGNVGFVSGRRGCCTIVRGHLGCGPVPDTNARDQKGAASGTTRRGVRGGARRALRLYGGVALSLREATIVQKESSGSTWERYEWVLTPESPFNLYAGLEFIQESLIAYARFGVLGEGIGTISAGAIRNF